MIKKFNLSEFGYEVEIGKVARQADGAVWFSHGDTVLLATVVSAKSEEFPGFLPLTVDYREQFSAAGKIPGGYFKREGRPTDKEVLTSRLIDRALRPLFPENYFDQVQVLVTVCSVDKEHIPSTISLLAASIALTVSKIPFMGPIGVVQVARVNGEWIFSPTHAQTQESDVRLVVAGNYEGINMVEGNANEISEDQLVDILFKSHEKIKKQVEWQRTIAQELNPQKEDAEDIPGWPELKAKVASFLTKERLAGLFIEDKVERGNAMSALKDVFMEEIKPEIEAEAFDKKLVSFVYDKIFTTKITEAIFEQNKRIDNRSFDTVRPIDVEVGLLPFTHGSSLFTRGRTQALTTATLGGGQDAQDIEDLMGQTISKSFMLHYNFPPFSVGEARFLRGPGRREVGHGHLAASAIEPMLPNQEKFPYTIRVVADMLESDGSTSMATTCGATMALMNAGVPIKKMVSGVAMGLLQKPDGSFQPITDINGNEDAYGLMDFKVTGTEDGITAIQMDIKYKGGLPKEVFQKALKQAKEGRAHILGEMKKVMDKPNPKLSDLVPQVVTVRVPTDRIGAIIGSGGKIIKDIIEKTETAIDIEDDGLVKIFGHPGPKTDKAVAWVKVLGGAIEKNAVYHGIVKRVAEFGIFVEIAPGQDGLVHVSMIPREHQKTMVKDYPVDMAVMVQVMDYDDNTGRIRLKFVADKTEK